MQALPGSDNRTKSYIKAALIAAVSCFLTVGCAPNNTKPISLPAPDPMAKPDPDAPLTYEAPATPTVNIPKTVPPGEVPFQAPPSAAISQDNKIIILDSMTVIKPVASYSSSEKKLSITGQVQIKHGDKEVLVKKDFLLKGLHKENESTFSLFDEKDSEKPELLVRAQVSCIGINSKRQFDCSHIVIDIIAQYDREIYSYQLETQHEIKTEPSDLSSAPPPPQQPTQPIRPAPPELQGEEPDDSIDGSFNNTLPNVDLGKLFPVVPAPAAPVVPGPATPVAPGPATPIAGPQEPPAKNRTPTPGLNPMVPPNDKILSEDILETPQGLLRPYNQAAKYPNEGTLRNATSIFEIEKTASNSSFFELSFPSREKHYTTYEMAQTVVRGAKFLFNNFNKKLFVSNGSLIKGGPVSPHESHQNGLDIDLGYPTTDNNNTKFPVVVTKKPRVFNTKQYSTERTYKLLKYLFGETENRIDRVFIDQYIINELCEYAIKNEKTTKDIALSAAIFDNIQHVAGHGDHFHVRIKCSTRDLGCKSRFYRKTNNCDFTDKNYVADTGQY